MSYTVVYGGDANGLTRAVNELIAKGWRPTGGVSVAISPKEENMVFAQAMIIGG